MAVPISDEVFARAVNQLGAATIEHIDAAKAAQAAEAQKGVLVSLAEVLVRQGVLTRTMREAIEKKLQAQQQGGIQQLGKYKLLKKLGEGGMGAVYLADDTAMGRKVALKVLPKKLAVDSEFLTRFRREAHATGKLNHVNIIAAHDAGEDLGHHYYAMEYCDGESLDAMLKREQVLPCDKTLEIVMQVARGLKHAHEHGFIHRDIKPANIFLTKSGVAKILDLGLSKDISESQKSFNTQTGVALGTPHYISPEQARGDKVIDGRSDIYSLGATFYHLITGQTPFQGSTAALIMLKHLNEQLPNPQDINEHIPDGVAHIIQKSMAKEPTDRYRDCAELLADLELVIDGKMPSSHAVEEGKSSIAMRKKMHPARQPARGTKQHQPIHGDGRQSPDERPRGARRKSATNTTMYLTLGGLGVAALILFWAMTGKPKQDDTLKTPDTAVQPQVSPGPESKSTSLSTAQVSHSNVDDAWVKSVQALPAEEQVKKVVEKLKELNPNYDGTVKQKIENGVVKDLQIMSVGVTDIAPLKVFPVLQNLNLQGTRVSDLGPLKGAKIADLNIEGTLIEDLAFLKDFEVYNYLNIRNTKISDLAPLQGSKIYVLNCENTAVADLTPLVKTRVQWLYARGTKVGDFSPLKTMRLTAIWCDLVPERDTAILKSISTLQKINDIPVAEFWKHPVMAFWKNADDALATPLIPAEPGAVFLSDLPEQELINESINGWQFGKNGALGNYSLRIRVQGHSSPKGLSLHPISAGTSHVAYFLSQKYKTFSAAVAINDDSTGCKTPITFKAVGDGKLLWASRAFQNSGEVQDFALDVSGVEKLELIVVCPGDHNGAHAVWLEPRLNSKLAVTENAGAIDLLPLLDVKKDASKGEWRFQEKSLLSDNAAPAGIEFPYRPPQEYDLRVAFTSLTSFTDQVGGDVVFLLGAGDVPFQCSLGTTGNREAWLYCGAQKSTAKFAVEKDRRYNALVQVRRDGARVFVDGAEIVSWKTDWTDAKPVGVWRTMRNIPPLLGLGSWNRSTVFDKVEVLEISGKGTFTRPGESAVTSAKIAPAPRPAVGVEKPDDPARWAQAVDLFKLVDLTTDRVSGTWNVENGRTVSTGWCSRIDVPFVPPAEYDVRAVFSVTGAEACPLFLLSRGDASFGVVMGWMGRAGLENVNKASLGDQQDKAALKLAEGVSYSAVCQVRKDSIRLWVNGQSIFEKHESNAQLSKNTSWYLRDNRHVGLGATRVGSVAFESFQLIDITGKGTFARPDDPAAKEAEKKRGTPASAAGIVFLQEDFEQMDLNNLPPGWRVKGNPGQVTLVDLPGHGKTLCVNSTIGTDSSPTLFFSIDIDKFKGQNIRASARIFCPNGFKPLDPSIKWEAPGLHSILKFPNHARNGDNNAIGNSESRDWRELSRSEYIPSAANAYDVGLGMSGCTGIAYFDDLKIEILPPAITTPPLQTIATDNVDNPARWKKAVNLMPLIDIAKDGINGNWQFIKGVLIGYGDKDTGHGILQIPYRASSEYDFRITFERETGLDHVGQIVTAGDRSVQWYLALAFNVYCGFGTVEKRSALNNKTTVYSDPCLNNGNIYTSTVQVRNNEVKAYLDGKLMSSVKTADNLGLDKNFTLQDPLCLGLSNHDEVHFLSIEVLEVAGRGAFTRPADPAAIAAEKERGAPAGSPGKIPDPGTPAQIAPQPPNVKPVIAQKPRTVNLMPLINIDKDTVAGTWKFRTDSIVSDGSSPAILEIPYEVPEEYDVRVACARLKGNGCVYQFLSLGGRKFDWCLAGQGTKAGFECLALSPMPFAMKNDVQYTYTIQVRKDSLTVNVNGSELSREKIDPAQLKPVNVKVRGNKTLGIGSYASPYAFQSIEIIEITGTGKKTR